jgi:type I restriction enzyme M protein
MKKSTFSLADILKGSDHALTIFSDKEVKAIELWDKEGKPYLTCVASDKPRPAKPEEIVRQLYLKKLMTHYGYPKDRIAVEKPVYFGSAVHEKAADIVVWEKDTPNTPYIIVEVKKPKRKDGLEQLKGYCNAAGSPIGVWTNGGETIALHREEPNIFRSLPDIPTATQRLTDMLSERWTLEDLETHNKLVTERRSLKSVILDMEDLVLANAGVDAFDEVFKLVYAKLYDEWQAARGGKTTRYLDFRIGGSTAREFYEKVDILFKKAMSEWPGVFTDGEGINLKHSASFNGCNQFAEIRHSLGTPAKQKYRNRTQGNVQGNNLPTWAQASKGGGHCPERSKPIGALYPTFVPYSHYTFVVATAGPTG